jgi:uncharacterized membrane protein (UPF0127 family)
MLRLHKLLEIVGILAILVLIIGLYMFYMKTDFRNFLGGKNETPVLLFNEKVPLRVSIARTRAELEQGLGGRETLSETEGMLFVFPEVGYHRIWMSGMKFSIDIAWVDENGVIVDIKENVSPDTYPEVFEPKVPARYVIEARAYFLASYSIGIGDRVTLPREAL